MSSPAQLLIIPIARGGIARFTVGQFAITQTKTNTGLLLECESKNNADAVRQNEGGREEVTDVFRLFMFLNSYCAQTMVSTVDVGTR